MAKTSCLHQVFAPYGQVLKIVVIQKDTVENRKQALIQFANHENAEQAKTYLQGQNVYVGTSIYFTLDIQYSSWRCISCVATLNHIRLVTHHHGQSHLVLFHNHVESWHEPRTPAPHPATPFQISFRTLTLSLTLILTRNQI